jgi:polyisoprenyl-teichoic acid--peptidoglycan teichoic acid transferase
MRVLLIPVLLLIFGVAGCGGQPAAVADPPTVEATDLAVTDTREVATLTASQTPAPPSPTARSATTRTTAPTRALPAPEPTAPPTVSHTPTLEPAATVAPGASAAPQAEVGSARPPLRLDRTENFLVLGADTRPGPWMMHTDSLMLIAIDRETSEVGILSIPRDLWVGVPGWGEDRINAVYFLGGYTKYPGGGPALARRVAEESLGVPIEHVALIKMDGLARLVDAIGGVTVRLDCPLYEQTPDPHNPDRLLNWTLPAGEVLLDGANAKKFVTYRYLQSDFGRARRQQQLIWAIRNQAMKSDLIPRIPELWKGLSATFETDLSLLDMIGLARFGLELKPENVRGAALDHDIVKSYVTSGGAAVLVIKDTPTLAARLEEIFASQPLAELGKNASGKCPPPPPGFAKPVSTPASGVTP